MTRLPKSNDDVRKGAWGADEDEKLRKYVETYGTGHWRSVGKKAGLQRCGKSCRLRWTNYLRPDIRHGSFTGEEEDLIIKLHASHGSRWSLIAAQLPGRTDNDIKNHWNTRLKKKLCDMGIDPVTHQPIAELLRDLAGTMARSGSAGNQVAEEAARRCFRDNMLNKAVRECGRPPVVPSFFSSQSSRDIGQRPENPAIPVADFHRHDNSVACRFEKSANPANSAHSMDDSSSTEESLSGHSSSPPLYMGLKHSATIQHRTSYSSIQECSAAGHSHQEDAAAAGISAGREVVYLPSPQPLRLPEGITTPSTFIQELATCPTQSTLQIFPPDSDAFRRSPDCDGALRGMIASPSAPYQARSEQFGSPSQPQARWFSSRPDMTHDQTQFQSEINRFSTNNLQQEPDQIHVEAASYLQGSHGVTAFSGTNKMDRDGHLIAPIQAPGVQENMGFRCLNMNLDGLPLSNSSVGTAGPYHDILQVNNVDAGQFSNSANLTSSNMITTFAPNSGPLAGTPRVTPTGLRLHEYEVIPSPRVALWDY